MLTVIALTAGCLRMPESGPLVATSQGGPGASDVGPFIDPAPPQTGESPPDIVKHFLDAMMASSLQTSVARQFLSQDAQASWDPEQSTMTYADAGQPEGSGTVDVAVSGVNRLDAGGAWLGPTDIESFTFPMVVEDGEWRIAEAPDALIVPQAWFELRFRQVSLYFFDPTAQILVPEPVYVPRGEQLASSLVRGLLAGPQTGIAQVSRTFLPSGAQLELSVPISEDGVADVTLQGDPRVLAPEAAPLALAQLAWTLRQDPDVRSFTLTIDEEPVSLPEGTTQFSVDFGAEYDPTVANASPALFGLLDGVVAPATTTTEGELGGPLSTDGVRPHRSIGGPPRTPGCGGLRDQARSSGCRSDRADELDPSSHQSGREPAQARLGLPGSVVAGGSAAHGRGGLDGGGGHPYLDLRSRRERRERQVVPCVQGRLTLRCRCA